LATKTTRYIIGALKILKLFIVIMHEKTKLLCL